MQPGRLAFGTSFLMVALACCTLSSVEDEGLLVRVGMAGEPPAATSFETDLGYAVTVTGGFVAIASVEIRPCTGASQAARATGRDLLRGLARSVGIRRAEAHSASSPTLLGVPGVMPLVPTDVVAADLGELRPPPDRYCATRVRLGPADRDAVMLPEDGSMLGLTLRVEGTWTAPTGGEPVSFAWESTATPSFDHETPFELADDGARRVDEELEVHLPTLFDGLDLATIDPAIGADRVAARIAQDLRVELK